MPYHNTTFGCFSEVGVCCDTIFCACCQVGRQCEALDGNRRNMSCMWCCLSFCLFPVMPMCLRCKVSDKFGLEEWCCTSLVCGCLCPNCSLCMTNRELNFRGVNPGGCLCDSPDVEGGMR